MPWLKQYNSSIKWPSRNIAFDSNLCQQEYCSHFHSVTTLQIHTKFDHTHNINSKVIKLNQLDQAPNRNATKLNTNDHAIAGNCSVDKLAVITSHSPPNTNYNKNATF